MNSQRILGIIGILRILTLILGLIVLILTGLYHYPDLKEQFFFSIVSIILSASCILLIILLLDVLRPVLANAVDMSFHLVCGCILLLATGLMLYSVISIGDMCYFFDKVGTPCPSPYKQFTPRVAIVALSTLNGIIYVIASLIIRGTEYF